MSCNVQLMQCLSLFFFFWLLSVSTGFLKSKVKTPGSCQGFWRAEKRLRFWIRHTVKTQWFYWFVIVLVFFNTVTVAAEHYGQPDFLTDFLRKLILKLGQTFDSSSSSLHFRYNRIRVPGTFHVRNVHKNVRPRAANLL